MPCDFSITGGTYSAYIFRLKSFGQRSSTNFYTDECPVQDKRHWLSTGHSEESKLLLASWSALPGFAVGLRSDSAVRRIRHAANGLIWADDTRKPLQGL